MAANGDRAEGQWPFDPLLVPDVDVMHLLDVRGGLYSPPAATPTQNVTSNGCYSGNPFDWTAMASHGAYSSAESDAPPAVGATMAGGASSTSDRQDVSAPSSYVHKGVLDCTGCQLLREILHCNGFETTKLCIHGAAGLFFHATLEVYRHASHEGSAMAPTHRSFTDFMARDYAWVKHYLLDYAQQRAAGGYTVVYDSTSDFHDVLCTSMVGIGDQADDRHEIAASAEAKIIVDDDDQLLANAGAAVHPMVVEEEDEPAASGPSQPKNNAVDKQKQQVVQPGMRSRLAIQRERTSKLERRDISRYFHLPMAEACKELQVCATVLKCIRRKFGITRWPYRKINKIDNQIAKLRENGNGSAAAMEEIEKLIDARREIIDSPPTET